jgi:hypothetical protein
MSSIDIKVLAHMVDEGIKRVLFLPQQEVMQTKPPNRVVPIDLSHGFLLDIFIKTKF